MTNMTYTRHQHTEAMMSLNGYQSGTMESTKYENAPGRIGVLRGLAPQIGAVMHQKCIPTTTEDTTEYGFTFIEPTELVDGLRYTPVWDDAPLAPVRLIVERGIWTWQIVRCPYCTGTHEHGGQRDGDPRAYLGGRIAHCHPPGHSVPSTWGPAEYRLVAINGTPTQAGLDRFFPLYWQHGRKIEPRMPLTDADIRDTVWEKSGGHCWYCGDTLKPFSTFSIDHVTPVIAGGSHHIDNLVPCCKRCNSKKRDRHVEVFRLLCYPSRRFWSETGQREFCQ